MITLLVSGYAYIVWLFTAINPMPHLMNPDLILVCIVEIGLEALVAIALFLLIKEVWR